MFRRGAALPSRFDPLAWHIHEMLFGFAMAAIAGFLLTAIPNWTGATRGHTGRELSADNVTTLIYVLISFAAIARVAAAIWIAWMLPLIISSVVLWYQLSCCS